MAGAVSGSAAHGGGAGRRRTSPAAAIAAALGPGAGEGAAGDFGDAFGLFFGVVRFFFGLSPLRGCSTAYPLYRRVSFSAGGLLYPPVDWRRIASSGSTHVVVPLRRW